MRIGFSASNTISSRIIRWATHSKTSHSYIRFEAAGESLVVDAEALGIECEHYERFKQKNTVVAEFELKLPPEKEQAVVAYALRQLLKPYDFLGLVGFGWVLLNKAVGRKVPQPFKEKSAYFCSELVICALQSINLPLSHFLDPHSTSPEDLIEFLTHYPLSTLVTGNL